MHDGAEGVADSEVEPLPSSPPQSVIEIGQTSPKRSDSFPRARKMRGREARLGSSMVNRGR